MGNKVIADGKSQSGLDAAVAADALKRPAQWVVSDKFLPWRRPISLKPKPSRAKRPGLIEYDTQGRRGDPLQ